MNKINNDIKELILSQKDAVFATVSQEGVPNIVPIHSKHIISKRTILISDQFMNKTLKNVLQKPVASLLLWNDSYGCRINGTCGYLETALAEDVQTEAVKAGTMEKNINWKAENRISKAGNDDSIFLGREYTAEITGLPL